MTRLVMSAIDGPDRSSMQVAHQPVICHTPMCVRPDHLRWATIAENLADRDLDGTDLRGERHSMAKLTEAMVIEIRSRYAAGDITQRQLGDEYGVSRGVIGNIVSGRLWAHLKPSAAQQISGMMPMRVQRSRKAGVPGIPAGARYVGRPGPWGNPFKVGPDRSQAEAVAEYREWVTTSPETGAEWVRDHIGELAGLDLCCWCALDEPCHADVLIELANPVAAQPLS